MNAMHSNRQRRARGFTLVEILVALTIGMVLTIVVAQLFLSSRRTYAATDDVSRMQENMRFAQQLLERTIRVAGYRAAPNVKVEDLWTPANPIFGGTEGTTGAAADSFTIAFQGSSNGSDPAADGTVVDCHGLPVPGGTVSVNTFALGIGRNGGNALFCNNGVNNLELVPDVDNIQVLYGLDVNVDHAVDTYLPANSVGARMNEVRAMRVAMLFRTANAGASPAPSILTHDLNGTIVGPFNDTRIRRSVTMTLSARNFTP